MICFIFPEYSTTGLFLRSDATFNEVGWDTYVQSFHWTSWLTTLAVYIFSCFVFIFVARLVNDENDQYFMRSHNVVFVLFSCIVQQGVFFILMVMAIFIYTVKSNYVKIHCSKVIESEIHSLMYFLKHHIGVQNESDFDVIYYNTPANSTLS